MSAASEFPIHPNADSYSLRAAQAMWKEIDRLRAGVNYEEQTFEEACKLLTSFHPGRTPSQVFITLRNCGVLRNDKEVKAFDAWEQAQ